MQQTAQISQGDEGSRHQPAEEVSRGAKPIRLIDGFLPDAHAARAAGLAADFIDWVGYDGQTYRRVCLTEVPGLREAIERACGPVEMLGQGYRLNYGGELPNQSIHSDLGWGTHAAVVYLCDGPGGTAFWRHRATGRTGLRWGEVDLIQAIGSDWEDAAAWDQVALAPLAFNRAVIYEGLLFHSRWPFEAFGSGPEDGRLIAVAFFTPTGAA